MIYRLVSPCGKSHLNLVASSPCQVLLAPFSTACFGMVRMVFWTGIATFCPCCGATLSPPLVAINREMNKSSLIVRDCSCFTVLPMVLFKLHILLTNLYQPGQPWGPAWDLAGCEPCARVLLAFRQGSRNRWPSHRRVGCWPVPTVSECARGPRLQMRVPLFKLHMIGVVYGWSIRVWKI